MTSSTRLSPARYLLLLREDGDRLAAAAQGQLTTPVPTCPGWDVADVVRHTGSVFHHKVVSTRLQRQPQDGEWSTGPVPGEDLLDWYRSALDLLVTELGSREPEDPSATWYPPDQTVGFWYRRMAHETAVHRVDVESAAVAVMPVADDLAIDGVDEVLDLFLRYGIGCDPSEDVSALVGRAVTVRTGAQAWTVSGAPDDPDGSVRLVRETGAADAVVSGEPSELLLWLWGRRPDSAVLVDGDPAAAAGLRDLLARATQ